jgi:hypothetical protein
MRLAAGIGVGAVLESTVDRISGESAIAAGWEFQFVAHRWDRQMPRRCACFNLSFEPVPIFVRTISTADCS